MIRLVGLIFVLMADHTDAVADAIRQHQSRQTSSPASVWRPSTLISGPTSSSGGGHGDPGPQRWSDSGMVVTDVEPSTVGVAGGTATISGLRFRSGSTVLIGSTPATSVVVVSAMTITCVVPAMDLGTYDITVHHAGVADGTLPAAITYTDPPPLNNVQYDGLSGAHQQCDIIPGVTPGQPIVIVLHSGGWARDRTDKGAVRFWQQIGAAGACAVNADYYVTSDSGFSRDKPILNVRQCVLFFRNPTNAALYNGDHTKVYVVGHSAGGHLALMAAIDGTAVGDGSCPDLLGLWSPPCTMSRVYNSFAKAQAKAFFGGLDLAGHETLYANYSPSSPSCIASSLGTPATFPICPVRLVGGLYENTLDQAGINVGNYTDLIAQADAQGQTIITRFWKHGVHYNYTGDITKSSNLAVDDHQEMLDWLLSDGATYNIGSVDRDSVGSTGGAVIALTAGAGQTFTAGSTVKIGGSSATSVVVSDSQTITCAVPAMPGGLDDRDTDAGTSPFTAKWADIVVSDSMGAPYWTLTKRLTYWPSYANLWRSSNFDEYDLGPMTGADTPFNANVQGHNKVVVATAASKGITAVSGTNIVYSSTSVTNVDDLHLSANPVIGHQVGDPGFSTTPKTPQTDVVGGVGRWHRNYFQIPATTLAKTAAKGQIKINFQRTGGGPGANGGFVMIGTGAEFNSHDNRLAVVTDALENAMLPSSPAITGDAWHELQIAIWRDATTHIGYAVVWYDGNLMSITGEAYNQVPSNAPETHSAAWTLGEDENLTHDRGSVFGIFTQDYVPAGTLIEYYTDACAVADGFIDPPT